MKTRSKQKKKLKHVKTTMGEHAFLNIYQHFLLFFPPSLSSKIAKKSRKSQAFFFLKKMTCEMIGVSRQWQKAIFRAARSVSICTFVPVKQVNWARVLEATCSGPQAGSIEALLRLYWESIKVLLKLYWGAIEALLRHFHAPVLEGTCCRPQASVWLSSAPLPEVRVCALRGP